VTAKNITFATTTGGRAANSRPPQPLPKPSKQKLSATQQLERELEKIAALLRNAGPKRADQTEALLEALGVALAIIVRAEEPKAVNWRKALRRKMKASLNAAERKPQGDGRAVLEVVKVCFPEKTLSDWSRYTGVLGYCLLKQWKPRAMVTKFRALKKALQSVNVLARRGRDFAKTEGWPVVYLPKLILQKK